MNNINTIKNCSEFNKLVIIESHTFTSIDEIMKCFIQFPNKDLSFEHCKFININFNKLFKKINKDSIFITCCGLMNCKGDEVF